MQRNVLFLLVFLLILPLPAQAQNDTWEDGCDARIVDVIASTTDEIDYRAGCEQFRQCDPQSYGYAECQFSAFRVMLEQCPLDDERCHDGALLLAAAILAFDDPFGESSGYAPPPAVIENVPRALQAYWNGDNAGALAEYQFPLEDGNTFSTFDLSLPLSRAVLFARLGQPEQALQEYERIFEVTFVDPLSLYARSQLYAELGRMDEASFDIGTIVTFLALENNQERVNDALNIFVASLQAQHPLDDSVMQAWLLYPVIDISGGVAGEFVSDNSLLPPREIRLGVFDDLDVVVAIGLKNWSNSSFGQSENILQVLPRSETTTYALNYPAYYENSGSMALVPTEFGFHGQERVRFFEGSGDWRFMLAPADAPDPRERLENTRYCEDSVRSRLNIGAIVTTSIYFGDENALPLAESPGGTVVNGFLAESQVAITIIDGPECVNGVTWWRGQINGGESGWIAENREMTYLAAPTSLRGEIVSCRGIAPSLVPRLSVDTSAVVVPDLGPNNIRDLPSLEGELIGGIPPEATFEIIGGPTCVDGLVWWYVDYQGLVGWTAEGADGNYWLAPVE